MHEAHPGGILDPRLLGPEAGAARELARVRAAAHRERLGILARCFVVSVEQRLDHRAVRLHEKRRHHVRLAKRPANPFDKPPEARGDLLGCDGGGIAAVERLHEPVALDLDGAADHGERPEVLVLARDADAAAVGVGEQLLVKLEEGALVG